MAYVHFTKSHHFYKHFCFLALKPLFLPKCIGNRFAFNRPICPYAGLPVVPLGSKVTADYRVSHYTSPCFFGGLTYLHSIFLFPSSSRSPDGLVQGIGPIATNKECICGKYCYSCSNALLLARTSRDCCVCKEWLRTNSRLACFLCLESLMMLTNLVLH